MSCLFRSLSNFISSDTDELRQKICDFLEQNPIIFDDIKADKAIEWEKNISLQEYVNEMRKNETWGGAIEIKSFCEIFKIQVNVHISSIKIIDFMPSTPPVSIINISWNGNHFTSN